MATTDVTAGGNLPHWSQVCATFVTFRLDDALPLEKRLGFEEERDAWLLAHPKPWDEATEGAYLEQFPRKLQVLLDAGFGSCVLRNAAERGIVEAALRHFDGVRYSLYAFVVMPNHVHVLFMPEAGLDGRDIVAGWKRFTAHAINRMLRREGALWQKESYDHLVRDAVEFNACRSYIRHNDPTLAWDAYGANA